MPKPIEKLDDYFESLTADRGYDQRSVYHVVENRKHAIHQRTNAVLSGKEQWTMRNQHVHRIKKDGGFQWRREAGCYQQSKVKNTFYRYKTTILRARNERNREVETIIGCNILNKFIEVGRCKSILVV